MTQSPKQKQSKSRSKTRTTEWIQLSARKLQNRTQLQYDESGNAIGLSHFATIDGMYNGRRVYNLRRKKRSVTRI